MAGHRGNRPHCPVGPARRMKAEERMAMLQRGMTVEQIDQLLKTTEK